MKTYCSIALGALIVVLAGCTTSSQVQEMIDTSRQDYVSRLDSHEESIGVLRQSSMTGLERGEANAKQLKMAQAQLAEVVKRLEIIKGYADASKIMSAANTVKVSELDEAIKVNQDAVESAMVQLKEFDYLFEGVMLKHYEMIITSANEAIEALKTNGVMASEPQPVLLDEPIEIIAPDTSNPVISVQTNPPPVE